MSELTLSLFGTFRAEIAGQPLPFRSDKVRALLLYLAVEPGPHRRDTLATLLWGDFPDREARHNLAASLSRLRKSLAPLLPDEPHLLEVDRHSVHLTLSPLKHHVDVLRFESLLAQCLAHSHHALLGCPACMQRLKEAVACYAGTFLAGFTLPASPLFTEWQLLRQETYLEQVLEALYTLTEHALGQGEIGRAEGLARQQLTLLPWREEAHRQLMRVLLQRGQRSAALAQYEKCCQSLAEALGIAPEAETTALYQRIRQGALSHNLPAPTTPLIGQKGTLAQITSCLRTSSCRLLTLVGMGGIGKSKLALAAAQQLVGHFRDGVYLVLLSGMEGEVGQLPELLQRATLKTLQAVGALPQEIATTPEEALRHALRDQHLLLLLDNFETLLAEAPTLAKWLHQAPSLHLLVTSREPLNLLAETVIHVPQLDVPPAQPLRSEDDVRELERCSAIQLFVQSVQRIRAPFHLTLTNGKAVVQICQRVGGIPLALEMAAAWSPLLSAQQIAERLATDLDILSTTRQDVPERQRSMRVVFEHSWRLLTEVEQQALATLSIFAGSFSLAAAESVLGSATAARSWPLILIALLDKMLVYRHAERLELHPLVRQYADEKLVVAGMRDRVQARHSAYYAALVQGHLPLGNQEREHVRLIESEIENVRVAWSWAVENQQIALLRQFLKGLAAFYEYKGWHQEGNVVFGQALSHLFGESNLRESGENRELQELRAWLLIYQGQCSARGHPEPAKRLLEEGVTLATQLGNQAAMALALCNLGILLAHHSPVEGTLYLEQALALCQEMQDDEGVACCLMHLGAQALRQGNYPRARQFHEQNLLFCRRINHLRGIVSELRNLIWIDRALGHYAAAYHHGKEALALVATLDNSEARGYVLVYLIDAGGIVEGYGMAQHYFEEFLVCHQRINNITLLGGAYLNLGDVALIHGLYSLAETHLQQALLCYRQMNHVVGIATTLPCLGEVALYLGKRERAWAYYAESLYTARETETPFNLLKTLLGWARLLAGQSMDPQVIELLTLVLHHPITWHEDQEKARQLLAEVASRMDPALTAAAQVRGQQMELESAVAFLNGLAYPPPL